MERRIIHLNIANFCVAVEQVRDPRLRNRPVIIACPGPRAVVHDMSDEAYSEGVRKNMLLTAALRRCRSALVLPPRPELYRKALGSCLKQALQYTPLVERSSGNGHLYLDVTGTHRLFGPPPDIGWRLRNTLRRDLGLDPIWSIGTSKLIAKVASRLVKPRGEYIVGGGEEQSFLNPLPLQLLPGISPADLLRLQHINIHLVHQVTALSVQDLHVVCGRRAHRIYHLVRGIDPRPVHPVISRKQDISHAYTFSPDTNQEAVVRAALTTLTQRAGYDLRQRRLGCRRAAVMLLYSDGVSVTRQAAVSLPVCDDTSLQQLVSAALYRAWNRRIRLRQLTVTCSLLCHPAQQLSLFTAGDMRVQKNRQLSKALDTIRSRCGDGTIFRGAQYPHINTSIPLP